MRGARHPLPVAKPSQAAVEALARRQASLTALTKHPSWPDLVEEVDRKETRLQKRVLATALSPSKPVSQRDLDFVRGFIAGMRWFATVPEVAEHRLESYLREQGVNLEGSRSE